VTRLKSQKLWLAAETIHDGHRLIHFAKNVRVP